jgi:YfiH family protein
MIEKKNSGLTLWCFKNLSRYKGIDHFVSTRMGGHSLQPYEALNLSFQVGDDPKRVLDNRKSLTETLKTPLTSLTIAEQVHDARVTVVTEEMGGKGSIRHEEAIANTDALITRQAGICLMVLLADCVPILLCDPVKGVVGAVHAGWKGTLQLIAQKTVTAIREEFGSSPEDVVAGIGPSIGPCCYEVGPEIVSKVEDVLENSQEIFKQTSSDGKGKLDLWKANLKQLVGAGVPKENIEIAGMCTSHHHDLFYSYRYEGGRTGRFGAGILLRDR